MKKIIINSPKYGAKEVLLDDHDYDQLSKFKWHVWKNKRSFYARRAKPGSESEKIYMHRVILNVTDSKVLVDHEDHNGLNNQRNNIRICNNTESQQNRRSEYNSTSKYLGVSWDSERKKWTVGISPPNSKRLSLGRFLSEKSAAKAYDFAAKKHFGKFANLNFK